MQIVGTRESLNGWEKIGPKKSKERDRRADLGVVSCVTCKVYEVHDQLFSRHIHPGCSQTLYARDEKIQYQNKMQGYPGAPNVNFRKISVRKTI